MQILNKLRQQGINIVIVSHDHEILKLHCDRMVYLDKGKIVNIESIN